MSHSMVIFGASGDLTSRKLIPALYRLFQRDRLPKPTRIVGVARSPYTSEQWREQLAVTTAQFAKRDFTPESWKAFSEHVYYQPGDIADDKDFAALSECLDQLEAGEKSNRIYYLSTMPQLYESAIAQLGKAGLAADTDGQRRVVIEKPFGTDLASSRLLNDSIDRLRQCGARVTGL